MNSTKWLTSLRSERAGLLGSLLLTLGAGTACTPSNADSGGTGGSAANTAGSGSNAGSGSGSNAGSGGSGASGGSTVVGTSGPSLWVLDYLTLREVDVATGKGRFTDANLLDIQGDIYDIVPGPKQVWLTTSRGTVAVLDREADTTQVVTIDTVETWGISSLALGPDSAYVASGAKPTGDTPQGPPLVQVDAQSLEERARVDIFGADFNESADALFVNSDAIYLLRTSGFAVMKLDPQTLAVKETIFLGEDPNDVTGPRKDLYGSGEMVEVGDTFWIFDESRRSVPLLKLDKSGHEASFVRSLSEEFGDATVECMRVTASQDSVFVLLCDESLHKIAKLDGKTGTTLKTYDLGSGGAGTLVELNGKLYVDSPTSSVEILEIDEQSGASRVAYKGTGLIGGFAAEVRTAGAP